MSDQTIGVLSGSVHLVLSLVLSLVATYGSFRIIERLTSKVDELRELKRDNHAVGIVLGGILLASALIVRAVASPAVSALHVLLYREFSWLWLVRIIGIALGFIVMAVLVSIISVWIALRCFMFLTRRLDEWAEIRRNNVAVAITLGVIIVIMGMFLADGLASLVSALVPYPSFQGLNIYGG